MSLSGSLWPPLLRWRLMTLKTVSSIFFVKSAELPIGLSLQLSPMRACAVQMWCQNHFCLVWRIIKGICGSEGEQRHQSMQGSPAVVFYSMLWRCTVWWSTRCCAAAFLDWSDPICVPSSSEHLELMLYTGYCLASLDCFLKKHQKQIYSNLQNTSACLKLYLNLFYFKHQFSKLLKGQVSSVVSKHQSRLSELRLLTRWLGSLISPKQHQENRANEWWE